MRSHPTWVRGLKLQTLLMLQKVQESHPTWVRGLKLVVILRKCPHLRRTLRGCVD